MIRLCTLSSPSNRTLLLILVCGTFLLGACVGPLYRGTVLILLIVGADVCLEACTPGVPKVVQDGLVSVWGNSNCVNTT